MPRKSQDTKPRDLYDAKRVERYSVAVANHSVHYDVDLYLRDSELIAVCSALGVRAAHHDIGILRTMMRDAIAEKVSFVWEPWLYIEVSDFVEDESDMWAKTNSRMVIEVEIRRYDLSIREGLKYHKWPGDTRVIKGWPEAHERKATQSQSGTYEGESFESRALIRDTEQARKALSLIRDGMLRLSGQLSSVLAPSQIERTLQNVLSGGSTLLLGAGSGKKK
jgi:hypothetical protein